MFKHSDLITCWWENLLSHDRDLIPRLYSPPALIPPYFFLNLTAPPSNCHNDFSFAFKLSFCYHCINQQIIDTANNCDKIYIRPWASLAFFFIIFLLLMGQPTLGVWSAPFYSHLHRKGVFQWTPWRLTKKQIQILQNSKLNQHTHQKKNSNDKSSSLSKKTTKDLRDYLLESLLPQLFGSSFLVPSGLLGFEVYCLSKSICKR